MYLLIPACTSISGLLIFYGVLSRFCIYIPLFFAGLFGYAHGKTEDGLFDSSLLCETVNSNKIGTQESTK
jgi:hypothetical protein